MKRFVFVCVSALIAGASGISMTRASVLTFDIEQAAPLDGANPVNKLFGSPGTQVFSDYGDRVTWSGTPVVVDQDATLFGRPTTTFHYGPAGGKTPNVVATYEGPGNSGFGPDGGMYYFQHGAMGDGSPTARAYYDSTDLKRYLTLTADSGFELSIESFKIATFFAATFRYVALVGIDQSNVETTLWSLGDPTTGSVAVDNTTYNTTGTPSYHSIALDFQPLSNIHIYYSLDNVQFSQVQVPEPASLGLVGLGAVAMFRRRKN